MLHFRRFIHFLLYVSYYYKQVAPASSAKNPPDTSLSTFPLAYYGANFNRTNIDLELLSRLQIVILMQEDGNCWKKCCPNSGTIGSGQCGAILTPNNDSSLYPGCDPACDQLGTQMNTFERLQALAKADGRRPPHCIMYLNSIYLWPFDQSEALGDDVKVLDVHGAPHAENCDPGIYPSYFWGWDRAPGRDAWLATINRTILNGSADGAYIDCWEEIPFVCNAANTSCIAKRNGSWKSINENVTPATVEAYTNSKLSSLATAAGWVTGIGGTWFGSVGQNLLMLRVVSPVTFIPMVQRALIHTPYAIASCHGQPWNNPQLTEDLNQPIQCEDIKGQLDTTCLASFLMAVEPGLFLLCGGLLQGKERLPLGNATAPATRSKTGVWTRSFPSGTSVIFEESTGKGNITWAT
jgi:hypothetical protein